ncbi:hypothetical protein VXS03_07065 [Photobacterium sp. S4TG1]|uniref:Uncharacterized protein n=1 Tax=Photobacterium andalusiense TaxID=2204296 RepID=A0A1Y6MCE6_9GAMM|nr:MULTISPECIES: hypothetical protein [Photobacterium]MEC6796802.1 hypothetical protein [Photobacterium sp. S4TG1]SMY34235.1 hypothetical protein PAND9192_01228 [Photobacterium andalusiense]
MTSREIRIIGADTFDQRVAAIAAIEKHGERSGHVIHNVKSGGIWYSIEVHVFKCVIAEIVTKRAFKLQGAQTGSFIKG